MKNLSFKILVIIFFFPFKSFSNYVLLNSHSFSNLFLKLAETKYEKEKGLMNVDRLVDTDGMFFV